MNERTGRATWIGFGLVAISALIYWLCDRQFNAGRGDFFYLADSFLNGRTWLEGRLGLNDVIPVDGHFFVPFAPFPALAFIPLVALIGATRADEIQSGINALLAAGGVGMCWWLLGRLRVPRLMDRFWITLLFGFSTQILWVTTRGGVWHTGHLVATLLTFACLIELWGRQRAWLIGLLAGAAFLTRAPLAFAIPFYALFFFDSAESPVRAAAETAGGYVARAGRAIPWRRWFELGLGVLPSIAFFFFYNYARFGTPLESGYALATLPPFLEAQRERGLFSIVHVPMNLDYLFFHLPALIPDPPFFRPDGLGMSVLITSPGLLFAFMADWRRSRTWLLAGAAIAVLIPTLLYYGGGWLQYGYRYFLDSIPFVIALCGLAAVHRGGVGLGWRLLILFGTVIMAIGVYWAYRL